MSLFYKYSKSIFETNLGHVNLSNSNTKVNIVHNYLILSNSDTNFFNTDLIYSFRIECYSCNFNHITTFVDVGRTTVYKNVFFVERNHSHVC